MRLTDTSELLAFLQEFISEERWEKFQDVLAYRTRHIAVVLEDIYQSQNASAVLRTCELIGIQDVHIIENKNIYAINPDVALGSNKWINLIKYNQHQENTIDAFNTLRNSGYRIVATSPHRHDFSPDTLPLDQPVAFVFGTEHTGLSPTAMLNADAFVRIPMYGFTESYNISVSAALLLHGITERLRKSNINWKLTEKEQTETLLSWCRRTISRIEVLEKEYFKRN